MAEPNPAKRQRIDAMSFSDQMRQYYQKLFPYGDFFRWLSYGKVRPSARMLFVSLVCPSMWLSAP